MGNYNPNLPQILGQEWVGIREEDIVFSPSINIYELGHQFTTNASRVLQDARFYINQFPPGRSLGQVFLATIYEQGNEDATGPVRSVIIPCNSILVSGGAGGNIADLLDPSDNDIIAFPSIGTPFAHLHFATNSYAPILNGKRIVGVNFLYTLAGDTQAGATAPAESLWGTLSIEEGSGGSIAIGLGPAEAQASTVGSHISVARLGEVDHFWGGGAPNSSSERLPWTYQGLRDFEVTAGSSNRLSITYRHQTNAGWNGIMNYAALEVLFCEENRLYYGGRSFGESGFAAAHTPYTLGVNIIPIRDTSYAATPTLVVGDYTLVISSADLGDCAGPIGLLNRSINLSQYPVLNGLRQLYALPAHQGVQVNVTETVDEVFTEEESFILPQLSLHTSSQALDEVHVYGRQARAQVYGSITATQEILDSPVGGAIPYPWVRYYARRFGDTTIPLTLSSAAIPGSTVSLTPDDFDVLDEIMNGWKEVTLRFDTPPSMGAGTNPQWSWSATGETAGNRWEVLGVIAPALSGTPGNYFNQAPSSGLLGVATYGAPVSGSGINLGWVPGYSVPVSATTDDSSADAVLLFSQDPPAITGLSVTEQDQEVVGIGLDCGLDPCCVPSEIQYHRVTWSTPVLPTVLDLPGDAGDFVSTPDDASLDLTGNIDIRIEVIADNWSNGSEQTLLSKYQSTGNQRSFRFYIHSSGQMRWTWSTNGTATTNSTSTVGPSPPESGRLALRVTFVPNDGGGNRVTNFYQAPSMDGPWTNLGGAITSTSTTIFSSTANVMIGSHGDGLGDMFAGQVFAAEMRNGIDGTVVANPDFTIQTPATTSFTDSAGRVWTLSGNADLQLQSSSPAFGHFELQRMDTVDTDWKTIMLSSSQGTTGFNDYEARVGILSSYRIRVLNVYDFEGPWSDEVSNTLSTPGVTIGCDDGHLLIFTANEEQNGSLNLAYSSVWEQGRGVEESFAFPESQFVQLQAMYNRDFFTAFRPTERGGEQFSRTVLVQAAAISPETLADFTSLRDMAWADVSYICVRDEDGNRWFATVLVPSGRVLRDRRLYLAPVDIIEVTDTPSQVDP